MRRTLVQLLAFLVVAFPWIIKGQEMQPSEVLVQSWQRGKETLSNQILQISLGGKQSEYTTEIIGSSGKRYKLSLIHNPLSNVKVEHWKIELNEIKLSSDGKSEPSDNLLAKERPGPGGDNFPREDLIGYLYPEKEAAVVSVSGIPFIEGFPFYPIKITRKIRVEDFYVVIKVKHYKFSSTDNNKLDSLDLIVEFHPAFD